ncbi:MAG: hypothetical protein II931_05465 [Clostridia bacterium]|nr:hypothetical protein [Clostridia bacterium]
MSFRVQPLFITLISLQFSSFANVSLINLPSPYLYDVFFYIDKHRRPENRHYPQCSIYYSYSVGVIKIIVSVLYAVKLSINI